MHHTHSRLFLRTYRNANLASTLAQYPDIQHLLLNSGKCVVCEQPVVNSWLECVQFLPTKKVRFCIEFILLDLGTKTTGTVKCSNYGVKEPFSFFFSCFH